MQQTVDRNGKQLGKLKIGFDKRFFAVKMCLNSDSSVVQSVERRTVNPYVAGSSPAGGATKLSLNLPLKNFSRQPVFLAFLTI